MSSAARRVVSGRSAIQQALAVFGECSIRRDIAIESRAAYSQLFTQVRDARVLVRHGGGSTPPRARAAASPAMVRSLITSRSNSASAANIVNMSLPWLVVVSIGAPCSTLKPTHRSLRSSTVSIRCLRLRPSRSSFQITRMSSLRSALRHAAKPGRSSFEPLQEFLLLGHCVVEP